MAVSVRFLQRVDAVNTARRMRAVDLARNWQVDHSPTSMSPFWGRRSSRKPMMLQMIRPH